MLTADDPNIPKNISKYNFKDRCYKRDPPGQSEHMAIQFTMEGCSLHHESDEFKAQDAYRQKKAEEEAEARKAMEQEAQQEGETFGGEPDTEEVGRLFGDRRVILLTASTPRLFLTLVPRSHFRALAVWKEPVQLL